MNILFIGNTKSTFVERDFKMLSKYHEVTQITPPKSKEKWPEYISRIKRSIQSSSLAFGWFAGWHTFPMVHYAKKYRKGSIVVVGGYDAVSFPKINYGAFSNLKERIPAKYVLKNADMVLPVSNYLMKEVMKHTGLKGDSIFPLPTGYDSEFWKPNGHKERLVLTVADARDLRRVKIKGLDTFVKSAKYVSDAQFIVIGVENEAKRYLENIASNNVEVIGYTPNRELLPYYQKAKVYVQLSISEGLPNTLCEAMLAGDIPVGTKRGGIPEVMGNLGFYVPYNNPIATAKAIKKALDMPYTLGLQARSRVASLFPQKRRDYLLQKVINVVALIKYSSLLHRISAKHGEGIKANIQRSYANPKEVTIDLNITTQ